MPEFIMTGLPPLAIFLALPSLLLFGWADRRVGGDLPHPKSSGYGAVLAYAIIVAIIGYLTRHPQVYFISLCCILWIVDRSPGWKVGGSMTPTTELEQIFSFLRFMAPAILLIAFRYASYRFALPLQFSPFSVAPFIGFAIYATKLAVEYGQLSKGAHLEYTLRVANAENESKRGHAYGVAVAIGTLLI